MGCCMQLLDVSVELMLCDGRRDIRQRQDTELLDDLPLFVVREDGYAEGFGVGQWAIRRKNQQHQTRRWPCR